MRIRYVCYGLDATGYGEFSRIVVDALHRAGHEVSVSLLRDRTEPSERLGARAALVESLVWDDLSGEPDVVVVNALPPSFDAHSRYPNAPVVGYTMSERSTIPSSWVSSCNRMDAILVPARASKTALEWSGVTVPVHVVAPPSFSRPERRRRRGDPFTFLSVFDWTHPHKDPEALLSAYYDHDSMFDSDDRVLLRVKTFVRGRDAEARVAEDVLRWKRRYWSKENDAHAPPVELVVGSISADEMLELYHGADCYVSSHRGEGWGLPLWEAMAHGLPVVATAYGGPMDFLTASNALLVDHDVDDRWASVDVRSLGARMREAYDDAGQVKDAALLTRRGLEHEWGWRVMAKRFEEAVGEVIRSRNASSRRGSPAVCIGPRKDLIREPAEPLLAAGAPARREGSPS